MAQRASAREVLISAVFFGCSLYFYTHYLDWNEMRVGVQLVDPILSRFEAVDLTWPIFITIWVAVLLAIRQSLHYPHKIIKGLQIYSLIMIFRAVSMYFVALEPPLGIIPLKDPVVLLFIPGGKLLNKDLFFSGHTASLALCYFMLEKGPLKWFLIFTTVLVATMILWQKVHYSADVFVAPFVAYASIRIVYAFDLEKKLHSMQNGGA